MKIDHKLLVAFILLAVANMVSLSASFLRFGTTLTVSTAEQDFWQNQLLVSKEIGEKLEDVLSSKSRRETLTDAEDAQKNLEGFVIDLIELAKTNADAKAIVDKYQIRKGNDN